MLRFYSLKLRPKIVKRKIDIKCNNLMVFVLPQYKKLSNVLIGIWEWTYFSKCQHQIAVLILRINTTISCTLIVFTSFVYIEVISIFIDNLNVRDMGGRRREPFFLSDIHRLSFQKWWLPRISENLRFSSLDKNKQIMFYSHFIFLERIVLGEIWIGIAAT